MLYIIVKITVLSMYQFLVAPDNRWISSSNRSDPVGPIPYRRCYRVLDTELRLPTPKPESQSSLSHLTPLEEATAQKWRLRLFCSDPEL
jgi:hypothetical protein